jgi:hypothetical protein
MATTIVTKKGSGAPTASDLVEGELAVDTTNGRLYTENSSAAVVELGSNPSGNITFGDNGKAIFGAGSDLQIYHDGSNSRIHDAGTGVLLLQTDGTGVQIKSDGSESIADFNKNGGVNLYYDNTARFSTTATGVNITGSATMDGLTVDGTPVRFVSTAPMLNFMESGVTDSNHRLRQNAGNFVIQKLSDDEGTATDRLLIDGGTGDISFYDTSGNAKLFWDASAESLGIGNTSPNYQLTVGDGTDALETINIISTDASQSRIFFSDASNNGQGRFTYDHSDDSLGVFTNDTERMRIASDGNVGIGTDSPDTSLHISEPSTATARVRLEQTDTTLAADQAVGVIEFEQNDAAGAGVPAKFGAFAEDPNAAVGLRFYTGTGATANERMRIDASGNWMLGTTDSSLYTSSTENGLFITSTGQLRNSTNAVSAYLNRTGSDGTIVQFNKDGTTVGGIGTANSGDLYIGNDDTTLLFAGGSDAIIPRGTAGASRDAAIDLGSSNHRFKDLYRSGSTISTSDRNMKQDERDLTEAETRVAQACKGLLKAFRFIDAVQVDGDGARIHFGIIAQDLQAAFEAEGLDATNYAMFRPSTSTDENGNEQTRLGICYENLLAFIIAAI